MAIRSWSGVIRLRSSSTSPSAADAGCAAAAIEDDDPTGGAETGDGAADRKPNELNWTAMQGVCDRLTRSVPAAGRPNRQQTLRLRAGRRARTVPKRNTRVRLFVPIQD